MGSYWREGSDSSDNRKKILEGVNHPPVNFNKRAINFLLASIYLFLTIRHTILLHNVSLR